MLKLQRLQQKAILDDDYDTGKLRHGGNIIFAFSYSYVKYSYVKVQYGLSKQLFEELKAGTVISKTMCILIKSMYRR